MNINDLTIGQAKELANLFGNTTEINTNSMIEVGKAYLFRTVTHIELGRVVEVQGNLVKLEEASWIADTGRYHNALKDGQLNEIEPYPDYTVVNLSSLINFAPWAHPLPREQK